jgi:hypothetical protein
LTKSLALLEAADQAAHGRLHDTVHRKIRRHNLVQAVLSPAHIFGSLRTEIAAAALPGREAAIDSAPAWPMMMTITMSKASLATWPATATG